MVAFLKRKNVAVAIALHRLFWYTLRFVIISISICVKCLHAQKHGFMHVEWHTHRASGSALCTVLN